LLRRSDPGGNQRWFIKHNFGDGFKATTTIGQKLLMWSAPLELRNKQNNVRIYIKKDLTLMEELRDRAKDI